MEVLSDIFEMISSLFSIVFDVIKFLVEAVMGLLDLLSKLPQYTALMTGGVVSLPSYCQTALATGISVCILWMVIRRGPAE